MAKRTGARFGPWLNRRRAEAGVTLRAFALRTGVDPGNLSRYERGILAPPTDLETLRKFASALRIARGSADWYELLDLASVGAKRIPADLVKNADALERLPLLFRIARGSALTEAELQRLAGLTRRS